MRHQHVRPSLRKQPSARVCLTALFGIDPAARNDSNRLMNGSEPQIEIFKPFGEAFELMKKILFQPFDLKKWLVIGFAAWLANLGGGGGGFNYRYNRREEMQKVNEALSQIPHSILVTGICVLICFVLVLIVLFAWLRARG